MTDQLDRLADIEWDLLLVLDALRHDYAPDNPEKVRSPANCTMEWIKAVFRHSGLRVKIAETACITANPEVTRFAADFLFADRDDLWQRKWEHVNGLGTVPPEAVTEAVQAELTVGPDRPVYAHYAQPHGPYPMAEPRPVPVMRNNPEAGEIDSDSDHLPDEIIMDPSEQIADPGHWLTFDVLRDAYESNVEWVFEAIQPLLEGDRTVVITADHGELLGDEATIQTAGGPETRELYGHPPGNKHEKLREVPLYVV